MLFIIKPGVAMISKVNRDLMCTVIIKDAFCSLETISACAKAFWKNPENVVHAAGAKSTSGGHILIIEISVAYHIEWGNVVHL